MNTQAISDYLQTLKDIEAAIQFGVLPETIGTLYHVFATSTIGTVSSIISDNKNTNPFNTENLNLYISSSSTSDTQLVLIEGVDQNYQVRQLQVTLQGQTPIALPINFRTIYRALNISSVDLVGDVYIGSSDTPTSGVQLPENTYAKITYDNNTTTSSVFTIPANYTGFITRWYGSADKGADVEYDAKYRLENGVFIYAERLSVFESSQSKELPYFRVPEKTDLKIEAKTSNSSGIGTVTYDLILINNDYLQKFRRINWR